MKKSFMKKIEIKTFIDAIDKYRNMLTNVTFTKNFGILGSPGGGNNWCVMYVIIYIISKGFWCNATAMMYKRDMQLGGIHDHQTYLIHMNENIKPHRRSELGILNLLKKPPQKDFLRSVGVIFID